MEQAITIGLDVNGPVGWTELRLCRFVLSAVGKSPQEEHVRTFLITLTALGVVAVALPAVSANAQDRTVVVTKDRDHDRGLHRGWERGRHEGWRHHNAKVVVIKKSRHHHYD